MSHDSPDTINPLRRYVRPGLLPTVFCTGCGGGTVLNCFCRAVDQLDLDLKKMVMVTGIGCSSWIVSPYLFADTLHTTHGRAIAFATGVQIMRPDMNVVVIAGDGDISGIGGNHLIHAARRNVNLTVLMINNGIYGMTGGQMAPTTPESVRTTTTPYGNVEPPFDVASLVAAAGATLVSRWTTYHVHDLVEAIKEALQNPGFSFVEIVAQCTTSYGKAVGERSATAFLEDYRTRSVRVSKAEKMTEEQLADRIVVGRLRKHRGLDFATRLRRQIESVAGAQPDPANVG